MNCRWSLISKKCFPELVLIACLVATLAAVAARAVEDFTLPSAADGSLIRYLCAGVV